MSEIIKKLLLIKKLIKYEAEQLQKAPIEYKGADDGNFTAPKPKGNKIKEETLPNGLIHTVFHKEAHEHPYGGTVAPATYHVLSHPDLGQLASLELKHYQHKGPAAEGQISPEVSGSEVLPQYRSKGLGKQLYLAALNHHGQFQSDQTVSQGAKGVWDSLKNIPGVKHTDAQYELEDDNNTIVNPEAERDSGESFIAQIVNQGDFDKNKHKMFPAISGLKVNEKLAASEDETVSMPKKEFIKEHKKLVNVLRSPSHKDDIEEADEQELELEEELDKAKDVDWNQYGIMHDTDEHGINYVYIHTKHPTNAPEPVGEFQFVDDHPSAPGSLYPMLSEVHPEHRNKGLASAAYKYAEEVFKKPIVPSHSQTRDARLLWNQPNRPFGKSEKLNKIDSPVKINPEHGKIIADAYENMPHNPEHPQVKAAYDALINETKQQYKDLLASGLKVSKMKPGMENPYPTSKHLHADIENNNHMWYYPTEQGFGTESVAPQNHPMLQPTEFKDDEGKPMLANDIFRQTHDFIHNKLKNGFGPKGEHEAYLEHKKSYSPLAQKALATETMGQNSTVNFGKHGEHNRKNPAQTIFADQKAGLLPEHIINGEWHK
ncbi:MAG TPA: hypothetical protein PKI14_04455 [Fervidobacterium sp.]|nr:hypothetical protein [Fervidobacterium sp.]